ncbi:MAG: hypothetical protein SWK76_00325 [Actinomycetota bacterium]|nr:hypothetical protein [Actinomycetota bacterium]
MDIYTQESVDAGVSVFLELDWGDGDYQVGYLAEEYRATAEEGLSCIGPGGLSIDNSGDLYLRDTMNYRYVKYSNDGEYVGELAFSRIDGGGSMVAGPDCMYVVVSDDNRNYTLYRYCFEEDELITFPFRDYEKERDFSLGNMLCDSRGNLYLQGTDARRGIESPDIYYKINPDLNKIIASGELDKGFSAVGNSGEMYLIDSIGNGSNKWALMQLKPPDSLSKISIFPYEETLGPPFLRQVSLDGGFFISYSEKPGDVICSLSKDGNLSGKIRISDTLFHTGLTISRNGDIFLLEERRGVEQESEREPFRIYKVEVDWDSLNE